MQPITLEQVIELLSQLQEKVESLELHVKELEQKFPVSNDRLGA